MISSFQVPDEDEWWDKSALSPLAQRLLNFIKYQRSKTNDVSSDYVVALTVLEQELPLRKIGIEAIKHALTPAITELLTTGDLKAFRYEVRVLGSRKAWVGVFTLM